MLNHLVRRCDVYLSGTDLEALYFVVREAEAQCFVWRVNAAAVSCSEPERSLKEHPGVGRSAPGVGRSVPGVGRSAPPEESRQMRSA